MLRNITSPTTLHNGQIAQSLRELRLSFSILNFQFSIIFVLLLAACDGMKTELDITSIAFPPKLSVTAILDGGEGSLSITFTEGRALADYSKPFISNREIIRDGEIRLYENGKLIWSKSGPFDMSVWEYSYWWEGVEHQHQNGYAHLEKGILTRAGSEYRLEVDVEGYETAVSTAVMPDAPTVSASVDTSEIIQKEKIHNLSTLTNYGWCCDEGGQWPLTVQFTDLNPDQRKYFALDINHIRDEYRDGVLFDTLEEVRAIGVAELSKLQDNPEVETQGSVMDTDPADLYYFMMLLQSNLTFTKGNNTLNYYMGYVWTFNDCSDNNPRANDPNYIRVSEYHSLSLRVKSITTETFKYYRSLVLQSTGVGFFTEPVTVVGNIEKAYGCFSIINSVSIPLVELESCYYRNKEGGTGIE